MPGGLGIGVNVLLGAGNWELRCGFGGGALGRHSEAVRGALVMGRWAILWSV